MLLRKYTLSNVKNMSLCSVTELSSFGNKTEWQNVQLSSWVRQTHGGLLHWTVPIKYTQERLYLIRRTPKRTSLAASLPGNCTRILGTFHQHPPGSQVPPRICIFGQKFYPRTKPKEQDYPVRRAGRAPTAPRCDLQQAPAWLRQAPRFPRARRGRAPT